MSSVSESISRVSHHSLPGGGRLEQKGLRGEYGAPALQGALRVMYLVMMG